MKGSTKYPDWLTKEQAAKAIGVSVKTVERLADKNVIQQKFRERAGGSALAVFNPEDVARHASERRAADGEPFVMPSGDQAPAPGVSQLEQIAQAFADAIMKRLDAVQALSAPTAAAVEQRLLPAPEPHLLTTKAAVKRGYPRKWLKEREAAGELTRVARKWSRFELERLAGKGGGN